jgi:hypothetical protein
MERQEARSDSLLARKAFACSIFAFINWSRTFSSETAENLAVRCLFSKNVKMDAYLRINFDGSAIESEYLTYCLPFNLFFACLDHCEQTV